MEVRKLQLIGGSSYMVSLPKDWVRSNKLKQGDELLLLIEDDIVKIVPKKISEDYRIVKAKITNIPRYDEKFLERFVYALFIQGLDEVEIEDKGLTPRVIAKISSIVHSIIGMEVIDASNGRVVLRSLTSSELDVNGVLNRMAQIIEGIFDGIVDCMTLGDMEGLKDVKNLENDTDRLYLLAIRLENRIMKDISSPSRWNELRHILGMRLVAKFLEEIADDLHDFSEKLPEISEEFKGNLLMFLEDLNSTFSKVMKAYISGDIDMAEDSISQANEIEEILLKELEKGDANYRIAIYSLIDVSRNLKSIGEVAFNKAVRERYLS
ncbi:phosphate uptake regulator, PhoU [Ferroglobus placidus DSM 10642]|uniref:Phosphate uptake regulator, PhoU n=1 Tax=Ferroglobus placidus (strain DSM 10642 / AEDII12DO) TaxID=589924 RepID=D3S3G0_FERPA|nr:phosphate uptake regulator PhoU [Ferroglobus placidus]ADC64793.1 phosphate uptake regulator, PhoU [Ferroglobus placidus DSM 10642]